VQSELASYDFCETLVDWFANVQVESTSEENGCVGVLVVNIAKVLKGSVSGVRE
jgi:hypothetical protein